MHTSDHGANSLSSQTDIGTKSTLKLRSTAREKMYLPVIRDAQEQSQSSATGSTADI